MNRAYSNHIWSVEVPKSLASPPKAKPVTAGAFNESDVVWSKDGSKIYFTSLRERAVLSESVERFVFGEGGGRGCHEDCRD